MFTRECNIYIVRKGKIVSHNQTISKRIWRGPINGNFKKKDSKGRETEETKR